MGALRLTYRVETHRLAAPFRISGFVFESSDVVVVELTDGLATGQGEAAESWVGRGPNKQISPQHLEQAIGPDVLATLSRETGLSHEELLSRLTRNLPEAVDKYTPEGRIPSETELARF